VIRIGITFFNNATRIYQNKFNAWTKINNLWKHYGHIAHKKKPTSLGFIVNWHPEGDALVSLKLIIKKIYTQGTSVLLSFGSNELIFHPSEVLI